MDSWMAHPYNVFKGQLAPLEVVPLVVEPGMNFQRLDEWTMHGAEVKKWGSELADWQESPGVEAVQCWTCFFLCVWNINLGCFF